MTKEDILAFIDWLHENEMTIAGATYRPLLGTCVLAPLHEDDYDKVITDFLEFRNAFAARLP
jgi:hypothetical protein